MINNNTLPLIKTKEDLINNITTLKKYLDRLNSAEYTFAIELIKKGKCFVVYSSHNESFNFPSRFLGYINNTMEKHNKMGELKKKSGKITKDGRKTNKAIENILGELITNESREWIRLENKYLEYCIKLNLIQYNNKRKYWII